jgi:hypothetical protein
MPEHEHYATVDHRADELIVCSYSKTAAGFWAMNGHYERLPDDVDDGRLGNAVAAALSDSEHDAPASPYTGTPFDPVLRELGLRSYSRFMTGTTQVGVSRTHDGVTVTPMHNGGARTGFTEIETATETINVPSATRLGAAVRRAASSERHDNRRSDHLERVTPSIQPGIAVTNFHDDRGNLLDRQWCAGRLASGGRAACLPDQIAKPRARMISGSGACPSLRV